MAGSASQCRIRQPDIDAVEYARQILVNIFVPHAKDAPSLRSEERVPGAVMFDFGIRSVRCTIDLDNEPGSGAGEISNIRPDRMLPAKSTRRMSAQPRPRDNFGIGHATAQILRAFRCQDLPVTHGAYPLRPRTLASGRSRTPPPPAAGEESLRCSVTRIAFLASKSERRLVTPLSFFPPPLAEGGGRLHAHARADRPRGQVQRRSAVSVNQTSMESSTPSLCSSV